MALPERKAPNGGLPSLGVRWEDPEFERDFPSLYSFLMDTTYSSGKTRATGSISLFVQGWTLKLAINDKDRGLVAFVEAPTFPEILAIADQGICSDSLGWKTAFKANPGNKPPF